MRSPDTRVGRYSWGRAHTTIAPVPTIFPITPFAPLIRTSMVVWAAVKLATNGKSIADG
jgi:hypothetical protein